MSGFKSFVDPTQVILPSHLVAVVGPNGCGKSNIIDAVTWVLGESSPKYLRGESMMDVIFNGSTARKPVGQASVELIFDNSDGSMGGEYASYAEVSVKRTFTREGDSTYYLNGARCRKRDVLDLFSGTGLGPRSYAIIGQNMVSRMVEAKPDELRAYLEEASGISKYKERRHETELRMSHTRDNLARVQDLQNEIDKQLVHLQDQAQTAEKYQFLKQQERETKARHLGLQWRDFDGRLTQLGIQIQKEQTALEAKNSEQTKLDHDIEQLRIEQEAATEGHLALQKTFYESQNTIKQLEQEAQYQRERESNAKRDLQQVTAEQESLQERILTVESDAKEASHLLNQCLPELAALQQQLDQSQNQMTQVEQKNLEFQTEWDALQSEQNNATRQADNAKARIQSLEEQLVLLMRRAEQLSQIQIENQSDELNQKQATLQLEQTQVAEQITQIESQLMQSNQSIQQQQGVIRQIQTELNQQRNECQKLRGEQSSLEALQQTALGQRDQGLAPWLKTHGLQEKSRLAESLHVKPGWELAVEKILGQNLQAICIDDFQSMASALSQLPSANIYFYHNQIQGLSHFESNSSQVSAPLLKSFVKSDIELGELFEGIYAVSNLEEAFSCLLNCKSNESVVTQDGIWLSNEWIKILNEKDPAQGVFARARELESIQEKINQLNELQKQSENTQERAQQELQTLEQTRSSLQQQLSSLKAKRAEIETQIRMQASRLNEIAQEQKKHQAENDSIQTQLETRKIDLAETKMRWQSDLTRLEEISLQKEQMQQMRETLRNQQQQSREQLNQLKEKRHADLLLEQKYRSEERAATQLLQQFDEQRKQLQRRTQELENELKQIPDPNKIERQIHDLFDQHTALEEQVQSARQAVSILQQEMQRLESRRNDIQKEREGVNNRLNKSNIESEGLRVKITNVLEQFPETQFNLELILPSLTEEMETRQVQAELEQIQTRIERLGAINLMAIEEYATSLERKQYIDSQVGDLQAGLATLEEAIAKIDKETRTRFKETFDVVNEKFKELFPKIFGGGHASLELNAEDLLEAGVTMMACPPGKRNSTIYLLSGGEKTLTALALVFSIFSLNPAPFCLLDEVDAALDDANVVRFARLVKSMSNQTQFIFISHNKIAIEMGEHLIGVTMNEPGVSRLVSVDVQKAVALASS